MSLPIRPDLPKPPPPPPPPKPAGSPSVAPVGAVTPVRPVDSATSGAPSLTQDQVTSGIAAHERPSAFESALKPESSASRPSLTTTPDTITEHVPQRPDNPLWTHRPHELVAQPEAQPDGAQGPSKPDAHTKPDAPKPDAPKPDATAQTKPDDQAKPDAPKPDAPKPDAQKPSTKTRAKPKPDASRVRDTEIVARQLPLDRKRTVLEPTRTMPAVKANPTSTTQAQGSVTPTSPTVITRAVPPSEVTKTQPITKATPIRAGQVVTGAGLASAGTSVANDLRRVANGEQVSPKEIATNATKAGAGGAAIAGGGAAIAKVSPIGLAKATGVFATAATAAVSVHENVERARSGEISKSEAAANVTVDVALTGLAAAGGMYAQTVATTMLVGTTFGPGVGTALGFVVGTGIYIGTQTETGRALIDSAKKKGAELISAGSELLEQAAHP